MHIQTIELPNGNITIETGRMAKQADGAVLISRGETQVLVTAVSSTKPREGVDFLPLTCDFLEKTYAAGKIPGSFFRREGRPGTGEVLVARIMDRPLRPLFPKGYRCETQLIAQVVSVDQVHDPAMLALNGASAALHLSNIPFAGPVAGVRVGRIDGQFILNPTDEQTEASDIDFVVAVAKTGIVMVEGGGAQVSEEAVLAALDAAVSRLGPVLDAIDDLASATGRSKRAYTPPQRADRTDEVLALVGEDLRAALGVAAKQVRRGRIAELGRRVCAAFSDPDQREEALMAFEALQSRELRAGILRGSRIAGRRTDEIRPISCRVGLLPSNHGSALFTRGETQALVSATVGDERDGQDSDSLHGRQRSHFLLHYNFPPFSVGEARPLRSPGRREIGHGHLARTALCAVLPSFDRFPHTLRVVSDILESNGSSSMATVCGASLALMDAGVPLAAPVAGIAMGLVAEGDEIVILSDILGDEDHLGDMHFKVAGTTRGVTAIQLDNKLGSLPREVLVRALDQARQGRLHILERMGETLAAPRATLAAGIPQTAVITIPQSKVGRVIGTGGATIKALEAETGARIRIEDGGVVRIQGDTAETIAAARRKIRAITLELQKGGLYVATVAVVGADHVDLELGEHRARIPRAELEAEQEPRPGTEILVVAQGVDARGRLALSHIAARGKSVSEALNG